MALNPDTARKRAIDGDRKQYQETLGASIARELHRQGRWARYGKPFLNRNLSYNRCRRANTATKAQPATLRKPFRFTQLHHRQEKAALSDLPTPAAASNTLPTAHLRYDIVQCPTIEIQWIYGKFNQLSKRQTVYNSCCPICKHRANHLLAFVAHLKHSHPSLKATLQNDTITRVRIVSTPTSTNPNTRDHNRSERLRADLQAALQSKQRMQTALATNRDELQRLTIAHSTDRAKKLALGSTINGYEGRLKQQETQLATLTLKLRQVNSFSFVRHSNPLKPLVDLQTSLSTKSASQSSTAQVSLDRRHYSMHNFALLAKEDVVEDEWSYNDDYQTKVTDKLLTDVSDLGGSEQLFATLWNRHCHSFKSPIGLPGLACDRDLEASVTAFITGYAAQIKELGLVNTCRCHLFMLHQEQLLSSTALREVGWLLTTEAATELAASTSTMPVACSATTSPTHQAILDAPPSPVVSTVRVTRASPASATSRAAPSSASSAKRGAAHHTGRRKQPVPVCVLVDSGPDEPAETCDSGLDMGEPPSKRTFIDPDDDSGEEELLA
eukprot:m.24548 g.24548  ORF g.24548 m.24548 type:complete len:555 (-) comp11526_c0_seq1:43-1707(-)